MSTERIKIFRSDIQSGDDGDRAMCRLQGKVNDYIRDSVKHLTGREVKILDGMRADLGSKVMIGERPQVIITLWVIEKESGD